MKEYKVWNPVYRMPLQLFIWEDYKSLIKKYWFDEEQFTNATLWLTIVWWWMWVIWLKKLSIPTLMHEIYHLVKWHMDDRWFWTENIEWEEMFAYCLEFFVKELEDMWVFSNYKKSNEIKKTSK